LLQPRDHLVRRQAVGGNFDRIVGLPQRADSAGRIALIAKLLVSEHFFERNVFAASGEIAVAAVGAFVLVGREEDFALGMWEHDRALIAAFGDDVGAFRRSALPQHKL
jgi:hypothetical protein